MTESNGRPADPEDELRAKLAALDHSAIQLQLADIVKLKKPYMPSLGAGDRQSGPFGFGIVAEVLHVLPDGRIRNVSCYLYDPERKEIFLGPNGIPEFVDFHSSELVLYKRAAEPGYTPLS